ncbi:MAG: S-layer homology domain-containing protein [Armatimonadota bacterium]
MKQIAVLLAALLSLALVAPALAQPFADVPTDHWAYDAIAELAAKGLIEGYPDGAFRGDRAMTRYEMAMVVARLLARIEAIKIPPLPPDLARQKDIAAVRAALAATDKRLTAKLATVQRLVAEFRAELAALGVRVTAVEEELAAIRARLDNTRVTGDLRIRYNVYDAGSVSGGGTFRAPDARIRMRVTFTGRISPNTEAVLRIWAANNTACDSETTGLPRACGNFDVRFGNNYNYGVVSFDTAYVDIRNTWGANLWRVGRQFITIAGQGPFGTGLLYDPANNLGTAAFLATPIMGGVGSTGLSDGLRGDFVWGPINVRLGVFRSAILSTAAPVAGVTPGLGSGPALDHRVVEVTSRSFIPGWTLSAVYYQAWQHPNCSGLNCSGGTGYSVGLAGTLIPGFSLYADIAWWGSIPTVGAAQLANATAYRVGLNINLASITGMTTWNPNIDVEYHKFGPLPAGGIPPTENYATTILGQVFSWNMDGYFVRLNLTFSPTTRGFIMYESGNVLCSTAACTAGGGTFNEWFIRLTHTLRPNTTVQLNYFRATNATIGSAAFGGDYVNFYRAELLYNW